ncbi:hypothetical protein BLA29_013779 [Euroglyphus maynei]|uniref:Secreted protein n=1 Tax=Euroglyphus maynei TaxID=6958 RepID=A0A1Y3B4L5_EURMA|nr:hypothetical protein BLA29_013779 [Euroglyphus maynei]
MHLSAFTFLMIGVILECGTICLAGRIKNLYDDEDEQTLEMKSVEPPPQTEEAQPQPAITVTNLEKSEGTKAT